MVNVLLLSTYELGHQPLGLARPAAHLAAAGHTVSCNDLSVQHLDEAAAREADLVGISVPMHTATRLGTRLAERIRALNPRAHVCFYGLYASLNADGLLGRYADSVIGGEYEQPLVELVSGYPGSRVTPPPGVMTAFGGETFLGRQHFALPRRDLLPPLERYSRLDDGERQKLVGYVEASRGCAHRCLHCPITPVYGGRMRITEQEVVLEDIRQLVSMGAEHITFGDPDFFNGIKHSCRIVESFHAEFPRLTYDATIKVEHLLEHRSLLSLLKETGCAFVLSAVEAVDDGVLAHLQKGHTASDVDIALGLTEAAGLSLRPTFVAFTPWTTLDSYLRLLDFVETRGLIDRVDAVQLTIRLLIPRGSSLLSSSAIHPFLGPYDESTFIYSWRHDDPRVDQLQSAAAAVAEEAAQAPDNVFETFHRLKSLALSADAGRPIAAAPLAHPGLRQFAPRLTEPWFC